MSEKRTSLRIDVRQPDDAAADPWEDAVNLPVYQMDFVDKVREAADKDSALVLRGYREDLSATFARDKLVKYGFTDVSLSEEMGAPVEAAPSMTDGPRRIDLEKSRVGWTGRNIASSHSGYIPLLGGELTVEDGCLTGFSVEVDMTGIVCEDISDRSTAAVLEAHLKNEDFFEADRFPKACFVSTSIERAGGSGSPHITVTGDLEIRGKTREVTVDGVFGSTFEGVPAASASFEIDRTEWGSLYGSPRFFRRLFGHFVREKVSLSVTLVAE